MELPFGLGHVRSGYISIYDGYLRLTGVNGSYWGRTNSTSANVYYLDFFTSDARPSIGPNNRYNGFSLRCLQE